MSNLARANSVDAVVRRSAARTPNAVALHFADRSLTYAELDGRANRLAHHLRDLGVGRESLVALCLPRSEWLVVGALAVAKAGGAYVPVDPTAPPDRIAHVLGDSAPRVLLVDGGEAVYLAHWMRRSGLADLLPVR